MEQKLNIIEEDPLIETKRNIDKSFTGPVKKSLLRYVFIVIDTTQTSTRVDFKPSRIGVTQLYL